MLLPALSKAKSAAVRSQCASNLKQWGMAINILQLCGVDRPDWLERPAPKQKRQKRQAQSKEFANHWGSFLYASVVDCGCPFCRFSFDGKGPDIHPLLRAVDPRGLSS